MPDELEERLKSHARSFDSLLSLIPAKLYYGEDVSDQWKRKKQTPEQKKAAKIAKLDPDNWKSAKDVMDERAAAALKRKREDEGENSGSDDDHSEKPKAEQDRESKKSKKRKIQKERTTDNAAQTRPQGSAEEENDEERRQRKAAQRAAKREKKQAMKLKAKEKWEKTKAKQKEAKSNKPVKKRKPKTTTQAAIDNERSDEDANSDDGDDGEPAEAIELDGTITTDLVDLNRDDQSTASSSEAEASILSPQLPSASSSISSISAPLAPEPTLIRKPQPNPPTSSPPLDTDTLTPKQRLEARIAELRAERKADDPTGRPARNRQELLEQRRKKEEASKAAKKEQRRKEKEDQTAREDEEIARRFSPGGSGSLLASPRSPMVEAANSFTFGRVAFEDGTSTTASLSTLVAQRKSKGPADPATALQAAQNKAARLSGLDETKRQNIEQQDMWLNAKKKAHGERVRDDASLLKKALKRKEGEKRKSEKEWGVRGEGVRFGIEKRQQKREGNLQKRIDEKGNKGKKTGGKGGAKKVKRPGFEGSFRGRTGGGKGKK